MSVTESWLDLQRMYATIRAVVLIIPLACVWQMWKKALDEYRLSMEDGFGG